MAKQVLYVFVEDAKYYDSKEMKKVLAKKGVGILLKPGDPITDKNRQYFDGARSIACFMHEFYEVGPGVHARCIVLSVEDKLDFYGIPGSLVLDEDEKTVGFCEATVCGTSLFEGIQNLFGYADDIADVVNQVRCQNLCLNKQSINVVNDAVHSQIRCLHEALMAGIKLKFEQVSQYKDLRLRAM